VGPFAGARVQLRAAPSNGLAIGALFGCEGAPSPCDDGSRSFPRAGEAVARSSSRTSFFLFLLPISLHPATQDESSSRRRSDGGETVWGRRSKQPTASLFPFFFVS
jgi:hypothetical protein